MKIREISKRTWRTVCVYDTTNEVDLRVLADSLGCNKTNILLSEGIEQETVTHIFRPQHSEGV